MKYLLALLIFASGLRLNAQDEKVIKKEVKTKKVIKKSKSEEDVSLEVKVKIVDGKEISSYILKETKDGKTKVTEWNGEGEMPQNIKSYMEIEEIHKMSGDKEKVIIIEMDDNGDKKVMKWNSDEEMSDEIKNMLEENEMEFGESENIIIRKEKVYKRKSDFPLYDVKVKMDIRLNPTPDGVEIAFVQADGPGDKAGIREGDILLRIGEQMIFTDESVYKALSKFEPGDKVKIEVLRKGVKKSAEVLLVKN